MVRLNAALCVSHISPSRRSVASWMSSDTASMLRCLLSSFSPFLFGRLCQPDPIPANGCPSVRLPQEPKKCCLFSIPCIASIRLEIVCRLSSVKHGVRLLGTASADSTTGVSRPTRGRAPFIRPPCFIPIVSDVTRCSPVSSTIKLRRHRLSDQPQLAVGDYYRKDILALWLLHLVSLVKS